MNSCIRWCAKYVCYCVFRALNVTLVFNNEGQRFVRVGLAVPLFGSVSTLRAMVAEEGKISSDQVRHAVYHICWCFLSLCLICSYSWTIVCNTHSHHSFIIKYCIALHKHTLQSLAREEFLLHTSSRLVKNNS